jgi:hypothetical protein
MMSGASIARFSQPVKIDHVRTLAFGARSLQGKRPTSGWNYTAGRSIPWQRFRLVFLQEAGVFVARGDQVFQESTNVAVADVDEHYNHTDQATDVLREAAKKVAQRKQPPTSESEASGRAPAPLAVESGMVPASPR